MPNAAIAGGVAGGSASAAQLGVAGAGRRMPGERTALPTFTRRMYLTARGIRAVQRSWGRSRKASLSLRPVSGPRMSTIIVAHNSLRSLRATIPPLVAQLDID